MCLHGGGVVGVAGARQGQSGARGAPVRQPLGTVRMHQQNAVMAVSTLPDQCAFGGLFGLLSSPVVGRVLQGHKNPRPGNAGTAFDWQGAVAQLLQRL